MIRNIYNILYFIKIWNWANNEENKFKFVISNKCNTYIFFTTRIQENIYPHFYLKQIKLIESLDEVFRRHYIQSDVCVGKHVWQRCIVASMVNGLYRMWTVKNVTICYILTLICFYNSHNLKSILIVINISLHRSTD